MSRCQLESQTRGCGSVTGWTAWTVLRSVAMFKHLPTMGGERVGMDPDLATDKLSHSAAQVSWMLQQVIRLKVIQTRKRRL